MITVTSGAGWAAAVVEGLFTGASILGCFRRL
jgi:hypothetical protein